MAASRKRTREIENIPDDFKKNRTSLSEMKQRLVKLDKEFFGDDENSCSSKEIDGDGKRIHSGWQLATHWGRLAVEYYDSKRSPEDKEQLFTWLDKYSLRGSADAACASALKLLLNKNELCESEIRVLGLWLSNTYQARHVAGCVANYFNKIFSYQDRHVTSLEGLLGADFIEDIVVSLFKHWDEYSGHDTPESSAFDSSVVLGKVLDLAYPSDIERYRFMRDVAIRCKEFHLTDIREALFMVAEYYLFDVCDIFGIHRQDGYKNYLTDFQMSGLLELMKECGFHTCEQYFNYVVEEQDCDWIEICNKEHPKFLDHIRSIWCTSDPKENLQKKCVRTIQENNLDFSTIPNIICERFCLSPEW
jgi:hypothetical protein